MCVCVCVCVCVCEREREREREGGMKYFLLLCDGRFTESTCSFDRQVYTLSCESNSTQSMEFLFVCL